MASHAKGSEAYELSVTTGLAEHPAFPARWLLRLMPDPPGWHILSTRRHATVLRLAVRSDDFAFARLDATRTPASPGFAVCRLPRPSCTPETIASYEIGRPAPTIISDVPAAVSVRRDPARASDDGLTPLWWPERPASTLDDVLRQVKSCRTRNIVAANEIQLLPQHVPQRDHRFPMIIQNGLDRV